MRHIACILFWVIIASRASAQIGTNPANPYGSGQPGVTNNPTQFKADSGEQKNVYHARSVKSITERNLQADSLTLNSLDTTLRNFENYSRLYQPGNYYINTGNYGLAAKPLMPNFDHYTGFFNGQSAYSVYLLQPGDINYYRNKSPFTDVFYITGKGQKPGFSEGIFHFVHARNIHPRLNVGIEYGRSGSNGYYPRQTADVLNFDAFLWYQSKNLRYNLISNFIVNTIDADENGGVQDDSIFVLKRPTTHPFQPVYLTAAHTIWNDYGFYARQYYLIGRIDSVRDSVTHQIKVYPTARAYYTFHYKHSSYNFNDQSAALHNNNGGGGTIRQYFPNAFLDTLGTADQTSQNTLFNEFGLSLFGRGNLQEDKHFSTSGIRLDASIRDEFIRYRQNNLIDSTLNNLSVHANAGYELSNRFKLRLVADYVVAGANHFNSYLAANGQLDFGRLLGSLDMQASYQGNNPDLTYDRWSSNAYRWSYHFSKVTTKKLAAAYHNPYLNLDMSGEYNLVNGFLYFAGIANQVVFPNQYGQQIRFLRFRLDKEFRFGKAGFDAHLVYQHNNVPLIVRTPDFYTTATLFYTNLYFKVLRIKAGLDATYYTHAYQYDYAPGLQQFYVYTSQQYGNYPVVDLFLLAGLKRTSLILRYDYANQRLPQTGYYTVHHYPMPDRLLKFGLSWKFYD